MQTIVIINAAAGTVVKAEGNLGADQLLAAFQKVGMNPEIHYASAEDLPAILKAAVAKRPDCIVVGGGDGTLNTAVTLLVEPGITLGILPFGTLNHFAMDLKIPADPAEAINLIAQGHTREVDLGEVNGRIFLNNFSIGAYPAAVRQREQLRSVHGHGKWPAMMIASWNVLRNLRRFRAVVEIDGRTEAARTPFILVSNNHYAGSVFSKSLRESIDAGELWIYSTRAYRILTVLHLAVRAFFGQLESAETFRSSAGKQINISLKGSKIEGAIDGELSEFTLPLRLRSRPRVLRVLVPSEPQT